MKKLLWVMIAGCSLCISSVQATSILAGPIYNPATGHSYFLLTSSDWTDAEATAVRMGGHLATVNDAAENDWIASTFSNFGGQPRALWIGLNDAQEEGVFVWSSGEEVSYTHWEAGQPDNGSIYYPSEDYVMIWPSPGPRSPGYWNDGRDTNGFPDMSFQLYGVVEITRNNNWTSPVSGNWESPNWSLGALPASDQVVTIVNDGYKAVNIDNTTVSSYPPSLTVGSLVVGAPANALSTLLLNYFGQNTPLKILNSCLIESNGTVLNLGSSFEVDGVNGGGLIIDGGTFTQEGGLTVVRPSVQVQNGTLNATNATMNLGPLQVGGYPQPGVFNQVGGVILSSAITIGRGKYSLLSSGTIYALGGTYLNEGGASFLQTGGSNYGDVQVGLGNYELEGGLVQGTNLSTITLGLFNQNGGTVQVQNLSARGLGTQFSIFPSYTLNIGTLACATLDINHYGFFRQAGGTLFLTNRLNLFDAGGSRLELHRGNAFMPSLVVSNGGDYLQYGGTNQVSGDITLYSRGFSIYGGRLSSANIGIGEDANLYQEGGTNEVSGVLSITGSYSLVTGNLSVNGIWMRGTLLISFAGLQGPQPVFNNTGVINFGGILAVSTSQSSMGQLQLSADGTINLDNQPLALRFASSSGLSWDSNSRLTIDGWSGSVSGNGSNQIYFGASSSGLTPSQVAQIRFLNPGGLPNGSYPAQLLSTGEIVPVPPPTLQSVRSGNQFVLTWPANYQLFSSPNVLGPYQPVPGATSPYTINTRTDPQRFFRLQSQ